VTANFIGSCETRNWLAKARHPIQYLINERRRALERLLSNEDWDEVSLDT